MKRVRTRKSFNELFNFKPKPKYLTLFEVLYKLQELKRGEVGFELEALQPFGCNVIVSYKRTKHTFHWKMKRDAKGKLVTDEQTTDTMKAIFTAYEHIEKVGL